MAGLALQIIMVITGLLLLTVSVVSLAKRKMTETFCLVWAFIAVLVILAGILLRPVGWTKFMSWTGLILLILVGGCFLFCIYFISSKVSEVSRKTTEMASQISILSLENEELKKQVAELSQK